MHRAISTYVQLYIQANQCIPWREKKRFQTDYSTRYKRNEESQMILDGCKCDNRKYPYIVIAFYQIYWTVFPVADCRSHHITTTLPSAHALHLCAWIIWNVFVGQKFSCNYLPVGKCLTHSRVFIVQTLLTDKRQLTSTLHCVCVCSTHVYSQYCSPINAFIVLTVHKTSIRALNQIEV